MAVTSPGDALPCSLPQSNAEKLRAIGAKAPTVGVLPNSAWAKSGLTGGPLVIDDRSVRAPANPALGAQVDLSV